MKKIAFLFLSAIALQSCSSDDSGTPVSGGVLLQSTTQTVGSDTYTQQFTYNGNKLQSVVSDDGTSTVYTYSGSNIVKVELVEVGGTVSIRFDFTYSNGHLSSAKKTELNTGTVTLQNFDYPDAMTIVGNTYIGDETAQDELVQTQTYNLNGDGEIATIDNSLGFVPTSYAYTYDSKHNPMENVTGYAALLFLDGFNHNVTSVTTTQSGSVVDTQDISYTYDGNEYPATSVRSGSGDPISTTYTYQ